MQVEGRNYLLPSGIAIDDPKARERSINLQEEVLKAFPQRYPGLGVAVIDACRDSAEPIDKTGSFNYSSAPQGCIVAFSASAGQVSLSPSDPAQNSFYTGELVRVLNGIDDATPITDIFELTRLRVEEDDEHPPGRHRAQARPAPPHDRRPDRRLPPGQRAGAGRGAFPRGRRLRPPGRRPGPGRGKQGGHGLPRSLPRSRYDTQVRVALAGAEDALKALSSRFVRLSASAFRSTGDPRYLEDIRKAVRGDKDAASRVSDMYAQGSNGVAANPSAPSNGCATRPCWATPSPATPCTAIWPTRATRTPSSSAPRRSGWATCRPRACAVRANGKTAEPCAARRVAKPKSACIYWNRGRRAGDHAWRVSTSNSLRGLP
jgi:hypothetical protein